MSLFIPLEISGYLYPSFAVNITVTVVRLANGVPPRAAGWQARARQDKARQRQGDTSCGRASRRYALPACGCNDPSDLCPAHASAWPCRYQRDARSTDSRRGPTCPAPNSGLVLAIGLVSELNADKSDARTSRHSLLVILIKRCSSSCCELKYSLWTKAPFESNVKIFFHTFIVKQVSEEVIITVKCVHLHL